MNDVVYYNLVILILLLLRVVGKGIYKIYLRPKPNLRPNLRPKPIDLTDLLITPPNTPCHKNLPKKLKKKFKPKPPPRDELV